MQALEVVWAAENVDTWNEKLWGRLEAERCHKQVMLNSILSSLL